MTALNTVSESALTAMVHDALMRGMLRPQVEAAIAEQCEKNGLAPPNQMDINAAYAAAMDVWLQDAEAPDTEIYAWHIAARRDVYRRSYTLNDYKTCAGILKDLAQLQQQYKRERAKAAAEDKTAALRDRIKTKAKLRRVK